MKKSSHLTRSVFRALIANRPYVPAECLRLSPHTTSPRVLPSWQNGINHQQRRGLFGFLTGEAPVPRKLSGEKASNKNLEVAIGKLVDLLRARKVRARPPTHDQLVDALKFLFQARLDHQQPLTRNEVFLATETFKYLQERDLVSSENAGSLSPQDLGLILKTLALPSPKERFRSDLRALAESVKESAAGKEDSIPDFHPAYITVLARSGSAEDARLQLQHPSAHDPQIWAEVLRGLVAEAKGRQFWSLLDEYESQFGPLDPSIHEELVIAFVNADKVWDAQRMFDIPVNTNHGPTTQCISQMLLMSVKANQMNLAEGLAELLRARSRDENVLTPLILYHAAKDPSFQDLRRIFAELVHSSRAAVSMSTFNDVIEIALKQNNPNLATAVKELAEKENFRPDGKTYALELRHALDRQDLQKAKECYEAMLYQDIPKDNSDLPILNRYIVALAFQPSPQYELVMRVTDNILERRTEIEPSAIAGLVHIFLQRNDLDEALSLLRHRLDFYPIPERANIANVFMDFIKSPATNTQRAFNAYELFNHAFPETPASQRIPLMQSFFDRERSDLACKVFIHMREADPDAPARPDENAYRKCFEGIAKCRDIDGLQTTYNMLKLDLQVALSTKIRNSLMLGYIACQMPWQAIIDHFYKIMDSREGPSYSTFEVAMRACETWPPYGSFEARKMMAVVQSWNLEITKPLYDNYIGVMAGQCEFENAVELIDNMQEAIGEAPDAFTIGTFYNVIPWQFRKDEVEKWARQAYPELWAELETFGDVIDEEWEVRYFKLDRTIDIDDGPLFADGEWKPELQRKVQAQIEPLPMAT